MDREVSLKVKEAARRNGADLVGFVRVADLPEHQEEMDWQTFMTGSYYYCFACQAQCPATQLP
jgi:hypothetical protein